MSTNEIITLAILIYAIVFFVTEWLRVDIVAISVVVLLMLSEVLETSQAIAGFSSSIVITIAALFVVGGGVLKTDLAGMIGRRILAIAGNDETRLIITIMIAVALLSGFMSDTGTVAVLLPAIISLSRSAKISPSKLLMPLSFGALLGGAMTLIGTPPNIVVSDLLQERGMESFSFFSYTPVGGLILIAGVLYMLTIGRKLLPDHQDNTAEFDATSPEELMDVYRLPDNIYRVRVQPRSSLVGKSIAQSNLRSQYGVTILEIMRRPVATMVNIRQNGNKPKRQPIHPTPETLIENDDLLLIQGDESDIAKVVATHRLALRSRSKGTVEESLITPEIGVAEVLLPPRSKLIGTTLERSRFGSRFNLSVLAINRPGSKLDAHNLDKISLEMGDTLLVQGQWENMVALREQSQNLVLMGQPELQMGAPNRDKALLASIILVGMLIAIVSGLLSVTLASMGAALLMVLTGCLTMDDAYNAIDWKSIVLIAGMLPMSTALQEVGLVERVANGLTGGLGDYSPVIILAVLFLMTSVFTQVLSNTATTVLIAPIAFEVATELEIDPRALLMAIAIAASMAFASPVASPVNTLVMGSGKYSFADYAKVGIPLIFIAMIISMIVLPLLFPF